MWVEFDKTKEVEEITVTDYEEEDGKVTIENLKGMVKDLLIEIEKRDDRIRELENKDEDLARDDWEFDCWREAKCLN